MPFDFHNRDRIDHLLEEIEELRYKDRRDLSGFCFWEDDGTIGNREPQGEGLAGGTGLSLERLGPLQLADRDRRDSGCMEGTGYSGAL